MTEYNRKQSEYNPDEDVAKYRGMRGMAIADAILKKYNYDLERMLFFQMTNKVRKESEK